MTSASLVKTWSGIRYLLSCVWVETFTAVLTGFLVAPFEMWKKGQVKEPTDS